MEVALRTQPKHCWKLRCAHNQNIDGSGVTLAHRTLMEVALHSHTEHCWKWRYAPNRNIVKSGATDNIIMECSVFTNI